MKLSRREFFNRLALLSSAAAVPGLLPANRQWLEDAAGILPPRLQPDLNSVLAAYLDALERPQFAPLNDTYLAELTDETLGLVLYDISNGQLLAALKSEAALPVASAFKSGVLMWFLDVIDPSVWNSVPVEYWNVRGQDEVPEQYRDTWRQHQGILVSLHQMIVISDNNATGRVMSYAAQQLGRNDPVAAFNDWSHEVAGISQLSGLSSWHYGVYSGMNDFDRRYSGREVNINFKLYKYDNVMTPRDLGLYFAWFWQNATPDQRRVGEAVLSIIQNERRANLERIAFENNGTSFSKNGGLAAVDSAGGVVVTDGGVIRLPDGHEYLLVFLSVSAENKIAPLFQITSDAMQGKYDAVIQEYLEAYANAENPMLAYENHLLSVYEPASEIYTDRLNYAFVKYDGIPIFPQPNETNPIRNPVISNTRFGIHLLMQGALVRYMPVDDQWVELIPDSTNDNVRTRLLDRTFVRMSDLLPISLDHALPIPYFLDSSITHTDKFIIVNIQDRELVAMERDQVVLKLPIVLNQYATPRGSYVITTKWFARSMQAWAPGVPFTAFMHNEGYAIHGSPWQYWEATVNQDNLFQRRSAGCINIPNWMVTVGSYTRPADELLFRWIGGLENPSESVYEYPSDTYPPLRVLCVDYYKELPTYRMPVTGSWETIIANIESTSFSAPSTFYITPTNTTQR